MQRSEPASERYSDNRDAQKITFVNLCQKGSVQNLSKIPMNEFYF